MIKSFADRRTQELYITGKAKRFPPDVARRAARKLEYVDLATMLEDLRIRLAIGFTRSKGIGRGSMPSPLTASGGFAFNLSTEMRTKSKFVTIIKARVNHEHS